MYYQNLNEALSEKNIKKNKGKNLYLCFIIGTCQSVVALYAKNVYSAKCMFAKYTKIDREYVCVPFQIIKVAYDKDFIFIRLIQTMKGDYDYAIYYDMINDIYGAHKKIKNFLINAGNFKFAYESPSECHYYMALIS